MWFPQLSVVLCDHNTSSGGDRSITSCGKSLHRHCRPDEENISFNDIGNTLIHVYVWVKSLYNWPQNLLIPCIWHMYHIFILMWSTTESEARLEKPCWRPPDLRHNSRTPLHRWPYTVHPGNRPVLVTERDEPISHLCWSDPLGWEDSSSSPWK